MTHIPIRRKILFFDWGGQVFHPWSKHRYGNIRLRSYLMDLICSCVCVWSVWSVLGCGTRGVKIVHCILCLIKVKLKWTLHLGRETGTEVLFIYFLLVNSSVRLPCWRPTLVLVCLSGLEGPNEYSIMFSLLVYTIILNPACHRISVHVRVELLVNYQLYILK